MHFILFAHSPPSQGGKIHTFVNEEKENQERREWGDTSLVTLYQQRNDLRRRIDRSVIIFDGAAYVQETVSFPKEEWIWRPTGPTRRTRVKRGNGLPHL